MALEQLGKNSVEGCVAPGLHSEVTASGGATRTLLPEESGGMFLWDAATGVTYTLPAPVVGMQFDFFVSTSVTSNAHAVTTNAATVFIGGAVQQIIAASATTLGSVGNGTSHVTISMNGTTTGGLHGTFIRFRARSSTVWSVTGTVVGSGTLATPFA